MVASEDRILRRRPDWDQQLLLYLQRTGSNAFRYGEHDCLLWALGAVAAMTGVDIGAEYRGRYGTAAEANSLLRRHGFANLLDAAVHTFGPAIPTALLAQRGDLIWIPPGVGFDGNPYEEGILGILYNKVMAPARDRIAFLPLSVLAQHGAKAIAIGR